MTAGYSVALKWPWPHPDHKQPAKIVWKGGDPQEAEAFAVTQFGQGKNVMMMMINPLVDGGSRCALWKAWNSDGKMTYPQKYADVAA